MLASCRLYGWPTETYLEPTHPLQRRIATIIADFCVNDMVAGANGDPLAPATDGGGVPTFHATGGQLAQAVGRLADPAGLPAPRSEAVRRHRAGLAAQPLVAPPPAQAWQLPAGRTRTPLWTVHAVARTSSECCAPRAMEQHGSCSDT